MYPHNLTLSLLAICLFVFPAMAQKQKTPPGGRVGVVVDERLAALRTTPQLSGKLVRRIGRGRLVALRGVRVGPDGIVFYLVTLTSRTHGWVQREAVVFNWRKGDDERLLSLIQSSTEFDRISRARIFLDHFPLSSLRAAVLLLFGDAAEKAATKLSAEAGRRLAGANAAPEFSYFLNYTGLDRYNRQGLRFVFDSRTRRFHYDGAAWRELTRRYLHTPEAALARQRLEELSALEK